MAGIRAGMETSTPPPPVPLADYDPAPFWDEAVTAQGLPRPHYRDVLEALAGGDLEARRAGVAEAMRERGVVFGGTGGIRPFVVDPVPRVLPAEEWSAVERGLAQRVRALNAFLADVYGEQAIVHEGVVPARVIERADHFEPSLRGRVDPAHAP